MVVCKCISDIRSSIISHRTLPKFSVVPVASGFGLQFPEVWEHNKNTRLVLPHFLVVHNRVSSSLLSNCS